MNDEAVFRIKHARTCMYVARQPRPKSADFRMPSANWRWVRDERDGDTFSEFDTVHPIIQMNIAERDVVLVPAPPPEVQP